MLTLWSAVVIACTSASWSHVRPRAHSSGGAHDRNDSLSATAVAPPAPFTARNALSGAPSSGTAGVAGHGAWHLVAGSAQ